MATAQPQTKSRGMAALFGPNYRPIPNRYRLPLYGPPTHPGEMLLEEWLKPLNVTQVEAAKRLGIPFQRLNGIIKGHRAVTADTALLLEALTGWDAEMWLRFQTSWDLWHALRRRRPRLNVKPLTKRASKLQKERARFIELQERHFGKLAARPRALAAAD
jgi:addiction module HigA family antidote